MPKTNRIAVFITVYNEEKAIAGVLEEISSIFDVYVIDDGSTDGTVEISKKYGAEIISHPVNLGQGSAVITAFKVLLEKNYDFIIEIDGDGQHDPKEIPLFIKKLEKSGVDIVAGSRILGSNYKKAPFARRFFLKPLTFVLNALTGYHISDFMCGFRAFRSSSLKKIRYIFDEMVEPEYIASEMWIRFSGEDLTAGEVPITLSGRKHGFSYKGLFRYGWGVISTIIRAKLTIVKYKKRA
jgi:glycosyltransferase involved in cell wall biosynthesis